MNRINRMLSASLALTLSSCSIGGGETEPVPSAEQIEEIKIGGDSDQPRAVKIFPGALMFPDGGLARPIVYDKKGEIACKTPGEISTTGVGVMVWENGRPIAQEVADLPRTELVVVIPEEIASKYGSLIGPNEGSIGSVCVALTASEGLYPNLGMRVAPDEDGKHIIVAQPVDYLGEGDVTTTMMRSFGQQVLGFMRQPEITQTV